MVNRSRFQEDHEMKKYVVNGDKASYNRKKDKDGITNPEITKDQSSKHGAASPQSSSSFSYLHDRDGKINPQFRTGNDKMIGSQVRIISHDLCLVPFALGHLK